MTKKKIPKMAIITVTHIIKQPDIILHERMNDDAIYDSGVLTRDLLNLLGFIQEKLPICKIISTCSILRTDSDRHSNIIEEVS